MTRNLFEGKNVLVVGGNSGIGLAAAGGVIKQKYHGYVADS